MRILAIIPAYNEEESISSTIEEFISANTGCDFVVVNDGSSDHTRQICIDKGYALISHSTNLGLTGAFQTGARYALANGYDAIVQFDADGQHIPSFIPALRLTMEQKHADIVIGSRFLNKPKSLTPRMLGSRILSTAIKITTGQTISDPTSGMRLYSKTVYKEYAKRFDFGPELDTLVYLMKKGAKVCEAQVEMRDRAAGESYLTTMKSISYMLNTLTSILLTNWIR